VQIVKNMLRLLNRDGWPTASSRRLSFFMSGAVIRADSRSGPRLGLTGRHRDWRGPGAVHLLQFRPSGRSPARNRAHGCQKDDDQQNVWRHLVLHGAPPQLSTAIAAALPCFVAGLPGTYDAMNSGNWRHPPDR
jgi:hypothetical protein